MWSASVSLQIAEELPQTAFRAGVRFLGSRTLPHVEDDRDIFRAWRGGDPSACNTLFRRHYRSVMLFFTNKVSGDEVEDLVQETFARATSADFKEKSSFKTFLLGIGYKVLLEHYKKLAPEADVDEVSVVDLRTGISTKHARNERDAGLMRALRTLPMKLQTALELYYWEELTATEAGEILGVPENTVRSRVRRAKLQVAQYLAADMETPIRSEH